MASSKIFSNIILLFNFFVLLHGNYKPSNCMKLKYQAQIDALNPSLENFAEVENKAAFRWTFEDINHSSNFLPVTLTNPTYKVPFTIFTGWALSFFETKEQGENRLKYLSEDKPRAYRKLGTHISEGLLHRNLGICEKKCDSDGHFNFFDYEEVSFVPYFKVIEQVGTL